MKTIIFAFLLLLAVNTQAQYYSPEFYNWHFGYSAAVTFKTGNLEPKSYNTSRMTTMEGCASISDTNATLLFYTNGESVWNRQNTVMSKGTGLNGNESSTQSSLIIKKPGSEHLYYIFTVGKGPYGAPTPQDFSYSIVDINQNDVYTKNFKIHNFDVAEKLTAVLHANDTDYWIIAHELNSANFVVALLTENGVVQVRTTSIGPILDVASLGAGVSIGQLKANVRGDRLATVSFQYNNMDLYRFDRKTGAISDHLPIKVDYISGNYGLEFSPSGQFVYISSAYQKIYQFNISNYNKSSIEKSQKTLFSDSSILQTFGSLQLAPNGKIYLAILGEPTLSVINKPDSADVKCDLQFDACHLGTGLSGYGLPNYCVTEPYQKLVLEGGDVCQGQDIELIAEMIPTGVAFYTYEWTGPNGFTGNTSKIIIKNAQSIHTGNYKVDVYELGELYMTKTIYISVHPNPNVKIVGPKSICPPDKAKLRIDFAEDGVSYLWSNGKTTPQIDVSEPGTYYVIATSSEACSDTAYFDLKVGDLDVEILGILGICENSSTTLKANLSKAIDGRNYTYLWSTGETKESIIVTEGGQYYLQVIREGGCIGYDTVQVEVSPSPDIELSQTGIAYICYPQVLKIFVKNPQNDVTYTWEDAFVGTERIITEPGVYKIYALSPNLCLDSAKIEVKLGEKPDVEVEFSNDLNICRGDSVTVKITTDTEENSIIWNDGSTDLIRTFSESGKYQCVVSDANGCSDTTEFEINVYDIEKPEIIAEKIYICKAGTPVTLSANQEYHEYLWSNGATTQSTIIDNEGIYKLIVHNETGCVDSAEIEILIMPIEKPEILASKFFICNNDTLTLTANADYATYLWSDGSTNSSIIVRNSGTYKVIVTNEIGCIDSAEVTISDLIVDMRFNQTSYSEETVCTGTKSLIKAVLVNNAEVESTINEIILNNVQNFKLVSPEVPFTIGAFESREIILEANSDETGLFETSIRAISEHPCYYEMVSSASQKFSLTNQIRLPEIETTAGEELCIPIYGKINCGTSPFVSSATIQISFDAEYFNLLSLKSSANFTKVIENGICTVIIEYDSLRLTYFDEMIDELCGSALIGSSTPCDLVISEVDLANDDIDVVKQNGKLSLEACAIEVRAIQYFKPTAMTVSPLPANENLNVTIESSSIGSFELILVAFDGTQEVLRTWENSNSSSVDLTIDVSNLSQGVYSLLLKAPWSIHYQQILILR